VIVDQAVVQLHCSAHLGWASYAYLVQNTCFVITVQQQLVNTMSILEKILVSRLENSNETCSFREKCNYTILLVHNYERCFRKGRVLQRFWSFGKKFLLPEVNKMWRKAKALPAFLGNDKKGKLLNFWLTYCSVIPQRLECKTTRRKTYYFWFDHCYSPFPEKV